MAFYNIYPGNNKTNTKGEGTRWPSGNRREVWRLCNFEKNKALNDPFLCNLELKNEFYGSFYLTVQRILGINRGVTDTQPPGYGPSTCLSLKKQKKSTETWALHWPDIRMFWLELCISNLYSLEVVGRGSETQFNGVECKFYSIAL